MRKERHSTLPVSSLMQRTSASSRHDSMCTCHYGSWRDVRNLRRRRLGTRCCLAGKSSSNCPRKTEQKQKQQNQCFSFSNFPKEREKGRRSLLFSLWTVPPVAVETRLGRRLFLTYSINIVVEVVVAAVVTDRSGGVEWSVTRVVPHTIRIALVAILQIGSFG